MVLKFELESKVRRRQRLCSKTFQTEGTVGRLSSVVVVVNEVTARSVRTQSGSVERPTEIRFVLGMSRDGAQLGQSVGELAPRTIAARAGLLELPTQFGLVTLSTMSSTGRAGRTRNRAAAAGCECVVLISRHLYRHKVNDQQQQQHYYLDWSR